MRCLVANVSQSPGRRTELIAPQCRPERPESIKAGIPIVSQSETLPDFPIPVLLLVPPLEHLLGHLHSLPAPDFFASARARTLFNHILLSSTTFLSGG
jgi:hypothetical protein